MTVNAKTIPEPTPDQRDRFWSNVTEDGACWVWTGTITSAGYGQITFCFGGSKANYLAHRVSYTLMADEIPDGLELDHLCHNTRCVNPEHLDPVTHAVNLSRSRAAIRATCKHGHTRTPENTYRNKLGHQKCRECARTRDAARRPRR